MLSLEATWISDRPRYRWKAFLLLMITALLLLTNMFTPRFTAHDVAAFAELIQSGKVTKASSQSPASRRTYESLELVLYGDFFLCIDADSRDTFNRFSV